MIFKKKISKKIRKQFELEMESHLSENEINLLEDVCDNKIRKQLELEMKSYLSENEINLYEEVCQITYPFGKINYSVLSKASKDDWKVPSDFDLPDVDWDYLADDSNRLPLNVWYKDKKSPHWNKWYTYFKNVKILGNAFDGKKYKYSSYYEFCKYLYKSRRNGDERNLFNRKRRVYITPEFIQELNVDEPHKQFLLGLLKLIREKTKEINM